MTDVAFPTLRPMSLVQLLDQAIRLYRHNFLQFMGIIAIPYIPVMVIQVTSSALTSSAIARVGYSSPQQLISNPAYWLGILGSLVVVVLNFFLVQGLGTAALTRAIADSYSGQPVGVFSSYRRLKSSALRLILALILMFLFALVAWIWTIIPCIGWISGPGLLFFMAAAVTPLIAPIVVLETNGAAGSVRRAWDLSRTRFWWLVGFVSILSLLSVIVVGGPVLLINFVVQRILLSSPGVLTQQLVLSSILQLVTSTIAGVLYYPLYSSAVTLVYFDLRVRSEGLDLAIQAGSPPALEANAPISLPRVAPATSAYSLITGMDILQFILLSLGALAVFILFYSIFIGVVLAAMSVSGLP